MVFSALFLMVMFILTRGSMCFGRLFARACGVGDEEVSRMLDFTTRVLT